MTVSAHTLVRACLPSFSADSIQPMYGSKNAVRIHAKGKDLLIHRMEGAYQDTWTLIDGTDGEVKSKATNLPDLQDRVFEFMN